MDTRPARGRRRRIAWLWAALLNAVPPAAAERLAIQEYTTADGLAHDRIRCVVPDSRGFLWVCTAQGLSRFDGRRFVTYGREHGLEHLDVNDVLETREGHYWAATNGKGVYRFDPAPAAPRLFVRHPVGTGTASNRVNDVFEDQAGRLWAGTDDGIYVWGTPERGGGFRPVEVHGQESSGTKLFVGSLAAGSDGRLWAHTSAGVFLVVGEPPAAVPAPRRESPFALLSAVEDQLLRHSDGRVFVGGRRGLGEWDGQRPRLYTTVHGLSDQVVTSLAEDRIGNVWIGTETGGVMRLARHGLTTFDGNDGLGHPRIVSIFETRAGELTVLSAQHHLNRFDGTAFTSFQPRLAFPASSLTPHSMLQDHTGGWWLATPNGLVRYPAAASLADLARKAVAKVYTARDGLASDDAASPFEDSRGDVWVAARREALLSRWDRSTGAFHRYTAAEGLPPENVPAAFGEDAAGTLWVGFREGGLARYRGGRFEFFGESDGVPAAHARDLHRDGQGRMWAATMGGGLLQIEGSAAGRPRFVRYSTANGLTSDYVRCVTDDLQGHLYLGTTVGVDRFHPGTGTVTHYTTADGLAQNEIQAAFRDAGGGLWFGTMAGVSRLVPRPAEPSSVAPVLISAVAVGGVARPIFALGERSVDEFEVGPESVGVRIDYLGFAFAPGQTLLFQYRLVGGDGLWSAPTPRDSVEYGALAPGRYRFEVRAHRGDGLPATVSFRVQPPVWRRWWFVSLAAAALATLALQLHRLRLRRMLELERVRTRIASDLHDDIGSSLSQIAILSEVAARRLGTHEPPARDLLAGIAASSREIVGSMSDIVWAIDPSRDRLGDLVHRMRRFASDVFTAREVAFRFHASVPADDLPVGADLRRQVFLIFKECVHNAARHSECREAEADVRVEGGALLMTFRDDGRGFDSGGAHDGHGLPSMRARADRMGGRLDVASTPGRGTTVTLSVPLGGPRSRSHLRRW